MRFSSVGHLMVSEVISATPSAPFKDVAKLLAEHEISGVPVIDDDDRVVGVVSENDLLGRQASSQSVHGPVTAGLPGQGGVTAAQLMSAPAFCVYANDTAAEAARTMLQHSVKRLPVIDEESRLVGIVTRRDLLQVFLRPDQEIRLRVIEEVLVSTLGMAPGVVKVHVLDGVVTLEGVLEKQSDVAILLRLTRQLDGVVSVVDRLTSRVADREMKPPERSSQRLAW